MSFEPLFANICILSFSSVDEKLFSYSVPESLQNDIKIGSIVIAPFGAKNRHEVGFVSGLSTSCEFKKIKPLIGLFDREIFLNKDLVELCSFMKSMCLCSLADAVKTILPPGIKLNKSVYYSVVENEEYSSLLPLLPEMICVFNYIKLKKCVSINSLKSKFEDEDSVEEIVSALIKLNLIKINENFSEGTRAKTEKIVTLLLSTEECEVALDVNIKGFSNAQRKIISFLSDIKTAPISEVCEETGVTLSVFSTMEKKRIVEISEDKIERNPYNEEFFLKLKRKEFSLSEEQIIANSKILELYHQDKPNAALLYGVTGSGKTNVILSVIDEVVKDNRGVLVLVPEIALTLQTVSIFASRYRKRVSVLHSALSIGERRDAWCKINSGKSDIVIGTRSAIFAPIKNLGLIVIDEEQEYSFKSDMTPRYHARDIARYRCAKNSALLLLCSATPSIESMYKAQCGIYSLITLKNRYGNAILPEVKIADMRIEPKLMESNDGSSAKPLMLGKLLTEEIEKNLKTCEQTVLFINRRGYQAFSICRKCGNVIKCPNCSVSLTYHRHIGKSDSLLCHYCGYNEVPKKMCTVCGSEYLGYMGSGTELLEETLRNMYPFARILRLDMDTTSGKMSHERILTKFRNKDADILLGTQMVAKGHDFPYVTLVGIVSADTSLFLDDFRANERTFSLLTQVIGRAGRGELKGRAVIQTLNPENETLLLSKTQNYDEFYKGEIEFRKTAVFPPFCDIITVKFISDIESDAKLGAKKFGELLELNCKNDFNDVKLIVYGPFEDTIFKVSGKYRMKYVIKCKNTKRVRFLIAKLKYEYETKMKALGGISIDINPSSC